MKKITIAYFVVALDGGVGNFILNYCDNMSSDDYKFLIITQDDSSELYKKRFTEKGFMIYKIPNKRESILKNIVESIKIVKKEHVDIIHANMTATNFFPLLVGWICKVKVRISHSHLVLQSNIFLNILKFLSNIFATDRFACGQKAGISLFGRRNFRIIYNAIDLKKFRFNIEVSKKERKALEIDEEYVIGNVGRFIEQKNHFFIIDVFDLVHKINKNTKLLLIGEGKYFQDIKRYIKVKSIEDSVILMENVEDVNNKMMAMDVFFLPSLYEGLPITLVEAQASGLPCVVSSGVDHTAKLSDYYYIEDLKEDISKWADLLLNIKNTKRKVGEQIKENYDIRHEAKKLDLFYKNRVNSAC